MIDFEELTKPFDESELEWKPQSVGIKNGKPWAMILCYVQARAIQNRLDEVFGPMNWKDEYRFEKNGVICRLSVYCEVKKEWIAKENGSPETDIESFKGGISGAFKRVASSAYGIGRYLYELDTTFAECSIEKQKGWKQAKTKDKPPKYFYWKPPSSINTQAQPSQNNTPKKAYPPTPSIDDPKIEKLKNEIKAIFKELGTTESQQKDILKKQSYWKSKDSGYETWIDNIDTLNMTNGKPAKDWVYEKIIMYLKNLKK